ncbi:hypothetical protein D3C71_1810740 [compost metagenome]
MDFEVIGLIAGMEPVLKPVVLQVKQLLVHKLVDQFIPVKGLQLQIVFIRLKHGEVFE